MGIAQVSESLRAVRSWLREAHARCAWEAAQQLVDLNERIEAAEAELQALKNGRIRAVEIRDGDILVLETPQILPWQAQGRIKASLISMLKNHLKVNARVVILEDGLTLKGVVKAEDNAETPLS